MINRPEIAENSGRKDGVHSYKEKRLCRLCKVKLSKYNPDRYCFAHQIQGVEIERRKIEEAQETYRIKSLREGKLKRKLAQAK